MAPSRPGAHKRFAESGDPTFFARRGYVHVVCNVRGTGKSEGKWQFLGPQELKDVYEAVEWVAAQPWCDGNDVHVRRVLFLADSVARRSTQSAASQGAVLSRGTTDHYRDLACRGGILAYKWLVGWSQTSLSYSNCRPENHTKKELGEQGLQGRRRQAAGRRRREGRARSRGDAE